MKIIGVIPSWKRAANLSRIVKSMLLHTDRVIIWDNLGTDLQEYFDPVDWKQITVKGVGENIYLRGRFEAFRDEEADLIMTCDDDFLPSNWGLLIDQHKFMPDAICANCTAGAYQNDWQKHWRGAHEVLLGWGAVFKPELARVLDVYASKEGGGNLLNRKADRIFSILCNRTHQLVVCQGEELPGAREKFALYRQKDHWSLTQAARKAARTLLGHPPAEIGL